jgi:hypothetical protein
MPFLAGPPGLPSLTLRRKKSKAARTRPVDNPSPGDRLATDGSDRRHPNVSLPSIRRGSPRLCPQALNAALPESACGARSGVMAATWCRGEVGERAMSFGD